ncbi:MAG: hypothetical protein M3433_05965 [Actinomycetota bacterium]|nr:hypothetical protein [Actinomycetota bacterium]
MLQRRKVDVTRRDYGLRASRAYIAGLGTTGVLLASSALLLFVVGAVVAFNGFSVVQGIRELEGLVVDRDEPVGLSGPALAAAEAAPAAGGVSSRPPAPVVGSRASGGTAGPTAPSSVPAAGPPVGVAPAPGTSPRTRRVRPRRPTGGGPAEPQPGARAAAAAPPRRGSDQSRQSLGETTEVLTDNLGRVVDNLDPGLGRTVKGLGQGVGQLVDGLTGGL